MNIKTLFLTMLFILASSSEIFAEKTIKTKIEAGLFSANMKGDISNLKGKSDFNDDLGYSDFYASYFSVELEHNYDYIPNVYLGLFNMKQGEDAILTKEVEIAESLYSADITSKMDYYVLNLLLYSDLMLKGNTISAFGKRFYTGDVEFDIGVDVKYINWQYQVINKEPLKSGNSWIRVNEFIPLPYLGIKYYRYKLMVYANVSALSFQDAKSISAEAGIDYRFVDGLFLSVGYMYENFDVIEDDDTVYFQTDGIKLGFKYAF